MDPPRYVLAALGEEIATPEPALSRGEILRLRLRMTTSDGARNGRRKAREARALYFKIDNRPRRESPIAGLFPIRMLGVYTEGGNA